MKIALFNTVLLSLVLPVLSFAYEEEAVISTILAYALSAHVILGLVGVMAIYVVWMGLLRKKLNISFLKWTSIVSLVSFVASWLSGGYYYVLHYGGFVKPVIKAGDYAWAHSFVTETKEHVFLILPFLVAVVLVGLFIGEDDIKKNDGLRKGIVYTAGLATIIGVLITLGGIIISGAVR